MNKPNHLILALLITLLMGAATTSQALIISFTGVSDTATPIPGGTGTCVNFLGAPSLSAGNVAFVATGSSGQGGVFATQDGALTAIADTSTAIPGGLAAFQYFTTLAMDSANN